MNKIKLSGVIIVGFLVFPQLSNAAWWPFAKISENRSGKSVRLENPDLACAGEATKGREEGILTAMETHFATMKKTMDMRKESLVKAWTITERPSRNEAMKRAASDYNIEMRLANKTLKNARDSIWTRYRSAMKRCGVKGAPVEMEKNVMPNTDLNLQ